MKRIVKGGICIVSPEVKKIDITNAATFGAHMAELIDGSMDYIVDLQNISFMDSSGLGKIIESIRMAKEKGKKIVFCNIGDAVKVLFSMVNLSQIAVLRDSVPDAEQFIKG